MCEIEAAAQKELVQEKHELKSQSPKVQALTQQKLDALIEQNDSQTTQQCLNLK